MFIILPEPDRNAALNLAFIQFYRQNPHTHLHPELNNRLNFLTSGSFAQISYSGEVNHVNALMFHSNFLQMFNDYHDKGVAVVVDCSSHLITDLNNYDVLGNAVLTIGNTYGDTGIKVSTNYAYDYFHQKYPNCRMIAAAHYEGDPEDREFFFKESWGDIQNNSVKAPRTAVRVNCLCDSCPADLRFQCLQSEDLNASIFSNESRLNTCDKLRQNLHTFVLETDQMPDLVKQGYKYFIFPNYCYSSLVQAQEYVKNLIKPEYRQEALNYVMLTIGRS